MQCIVETRVKHYLGKVEWPKNTSYLDWATLPSLKATITTDRFLVLLRMGTCYWLRVERNILLPLNRLFDTLI